MSERPPVAVLGPGASFGETALMTEEPRNAFVRATEDTELYVLTKVGLRRTLAAFPKLQDAMEEETWLKRTRLRSVMAEQLMAGAADDDDDDDDVEADDVAGSGHMAEPEPEPEQQEQPTGPLHIKLRKTNAGFGITLDRSGTVIAFHLETEV